MPHDAAPTKQAWIVRLVSAVALAGALLLPVHASATPPTPLNVLFVANGYYTQEAQIYNHLVGLGFTVTKLKDYKVTGTTNLTPYNLIIITEFAPNIPTSGINKIKSSGKPLLIVEYWDFWYSYKFGLVTTENCGYVGTTTIDMVDLDSRAAEYLGDDPQVYSTSYTVYGISELDLNPGVEPVAWSSESFGEYAVIADRVHKIIATGVYDTRKYTPEAWRLFDELIDEIAPMGPTWTSQDEEIQGLVDSGVLTYIRSLTGNEPAGTVLAYVWSRIFTYNLHDVAHIIEWELQQKGPGLYMLYPPIHILILHPPYSDAHDEMSWFLGEHYNEDIDDYIIPHYDPPVSGADLGVSAQLFGRTYFYMGDTWGNHLDPNLATGCISNINGAVECDDAIVRLSTYEDDPTNGLDVVVVPDPMGTDVYLPQTIDGVHRNYIANVWDTTLSENKRYSVPTGASSGVSARATRYCSSPGNCEDVTVYLPNIRLWYGTQTDRNDLSDTTGKSWVGCSIDGKTFSNCYRHGDSPDYYYAYFSKDKFVSVAPVEIGVDDLEAMDEDGNAPVDDPALSEGGTLLFGSAHPYRCSALYLAYVDKQDFGRVDAWGSPINVKYYNGGADTWTPNEGLATPIFEPDCLNVHDELVEDEQIDLWDDWYAITAAILEESFWKSAIAETPPVSIDWDFSGCGYFFDAPCDRDHCWLNSMVFTGDEAGDDFVCHFCSEGSDTGGDEDGGVAEDGMLDCLDHIMNYEGYFTLGDYPWPTTDGFGELSVKLMKTDGVSAFVMLSNHPIVDWPEREDMVAAATAGAKNNPITDHSTDGFSRLDYTWEMGHIFYRSAPVSAPWSWSQPVDTGTPGYGPYIIDAFSWANTVWPDDPDDPPIHSVELWYTTSVWHGGPAGHEYGLPGAYGVYTTNTVQGLGVE